MIISSNREPSVEDFKYLLFNATAKLNEDAKQRTEYYLTRNGQKLEDDAVKALTISAENTAFEGTIEKVSGQRFPDIVARKYYGVEVKSSKDDKWMTLGGSVNESTRVESVERIFLIFGKLLEPIEFRCRPYEDCLSEVVVTHYPRYKIDMNLKAGETIFDKMNTTYDGLRATGDPVRNIVAYYKGELRVGEGLWWMESTSSIEDTSSAPMKIRLWTTLSQGEKNDFLKTAFALFPDVFSSSRTKYERLSLWLVSQYGIVSTSMRDSFTAGGKVDLIVKNKKFENLPRVFEHVHTNCDEIALRIAASPEATLRETWDVPKIRRDRLAQWIEIASGKCSLKDHDARFVLNAIFDKDDTT
jgi:hypothetical protein